MEDDLLIRIALCLDPNDSRSIGIFQKALRAINPLYAKNEKDRQFREARRRRIRRESLVVGDKIPTEAIYPNLVDIYNLPRNRQVAVKIPADSIERLAEKIVRGIAYLVDKRYIELPYCVSTYVLKEQNDLPVKKFIKEFGKVHAREPGIVVTRAVYPEDAMSSLYQIEVWGRWKMYAHVGK